jgi:hypothetical protein
LYDASEQRRQGGGWVGHGTGRQRSVGRRLVGATCGAEADPHPSLEDFYDVWALARAFAFDGPALVFAVQAAFARRRIPLPEGPPLALTPTFHDGSTKRAQWMAFLRETGTEVAGASFADVAASSRAFLLPPTAALAAGAPSAQDWPAGGPWRSRA